MQVFSQEGFLHYRDGVSQEEITLAQLQKAFEAVIPGFYDAWREATNKQV